MIKIKYILAMWVVLCLLCLYPSHAMAVPDSTRNLDAYWIYKIQMHEKVLATHNEFVADRMIYDIQSQSMFVMNPINKSIDVIRNNGVKDSIMEFVKLDQFAGSPKAMAFGKGILTVIVGREHSLDTLVCLNNEGTLLKTFGMDSMMQGVFYNIYQDQFVVWSLVPQGYTIETLNMKDVEKDLSNAVITKHQFLTAPVIPESAAQRMGRVDPYGLMMIILAMTVVFFALALLYLTFKYIAKIYTLDLRKRFLKKKGQSAEEAGLPDIHDTTSELGAAIGLALYFYRNELHDNENTILTIQKAAKAYSPWSSKIYGIRKPLK